MSMIKNYPIDQIQDHGAVQKVNLTFGEGEWRANFSLDVHGNCTGMSILTCALANLYELLDESDGVVFLTLQNPKKETKSLYDYGDLQEEFLEELLIGFEITAVSIGQQGLDDE
ncbi:DUF5406 family protein [Photobacterium damselae]|uniref:DUF5406 family protein n=1 Tax=Photobacterium damselae TaxID=38293 RepID=UPI004069760C